MSNQQPNNKDEFNVFRSSSENKKDVSDALGVIQNNPQLIPKEDDSKPSILIIDDDFHVREALKIIFEKKYNAILCANGETGIENVSPSVFAVILDIKMEGKNGFETFSEIKKKNLYLPIIFLTAYQDIKDPLEIINSYRPFGYVIKGADSKQLLDTTESAVNYYQQINKNMFLVKALQSKNLLLQELRENLELKVNERTEELTNINKELQKEIGIRQKAEEGMSALLKEKEIILQEVHHRIKNNMLILKSMLSLQGGMLKEENAQKALIETESRIQTMMLLYDRLYQSVSFHELSVNEYIPPLVEQIIQNFLNYKSVTLSIKVDSFVLDTKRLQTLGIIINELLTNISKYAFIDRVDGAILVEVSLKPNSNSNTVFVLVQDNGNGQSEPVFENSKGFGLRLIKLLTQQLKGKMQFEWVNGVRFTLEFKL